MDLGGGGPREVRARLAGRLGHLGNPGARRQQGAEREPLLLPGKAKPRVARAGLRSPLYKASLRRPAGRAKDPVAMMAKKRVALILAGCGVFDGSEVHEASAAMVHLSRQGAQVELYAPDVVQMHVVNHVTGQPMEEKRSVLTESARIARGNVQDLAQLDVKDLDALIIPGGFGVAKNLCTWAVDGKDCTVSKPVEDAIKAFHAARKPIGLCCIAPVLAAKILPGCEVTVGHDTECETWPYAKTAEAIKQLGCRHVNRNIHEVHVDAKNKLVTTSAFMCKAPIHEVYEGIGKMVAEVLKLA